MRLEPATPADLPAVHALIELAYRGETARAGWSNEAALLDGPRTDLAELTALLANPAEHLLLVRDSGKQLACVALTNLGRARAYLGLLTIDPQRQARGLGRMLLSATEDYAAIVLGAERIEMTVIVQRPELIAWYERRGYAATGERRPFPYSNPRAGALRDDLEFIVLEKSRC